MSYTLTLDMRQEDIEFAESQALAEHVDLASLFVTFLRARAEMSLREKAVARQREALLSVAGGWMDSRTEAEIIADVESHRTSGREVSL